MAGKALGKLGHVIVAALLALLLPMAALADPVSVPPPRQTVDANGVDLFAGTFNYQVSDVTIGSGAGAFGFSRSWQGNGWRNSLVGGIQASGANYVVSIGGASDSFTLTGSGFVNDQGNGSTLNVAGGVYTYQTSAGLVATFQQNVGVTDMFAANQGRITSLSWPDGRRVDYWYKQQQYCPQPAPDNCPVARKTAVRLQSARNDAGYQIKLTYQLDDLTDVTDLASWYAPASAITINAVRDYCDPSADACAGLSMSWPAAGYSQAANGQIGAMTDPMGRTWSYSYTGLRLTGLRQPTSTSDDVTIGYDPGTGRVSSYATMAGTWQYASSDAGDTRTTVVTDPQGHRTTYMFQISNQRPTGVTDALGHTWSYGYDALGRLQTATAPEGNHSDYSYDASGNVTRTVTTAKNGVDTIATSAVYGNACPGVACASPTATTDARGATTDYGYDGYGHVTSVTLPAPAAGAARPQTRYGYDTRGGELQAVGGCGADPLRLRDLAAGARVGVPDRRVVRRHRRRDTHDHRL